MITIEKTTASGYEEQEYEIEEAINILNNEKDNNKTIWIDGSPFLDNIITSEILLKCKDKVCVTNKLIGG